jgi:hypothetical protein
MPLTTNSTTSISNGGGISRLLTAAVINEKFCKLLLSDPTKALGNGYNGETFQLSKDERDQILSIKATTLTDFAKQVVQNRVPHHILQPLPAQSELSIYAPVGLD